MQYNTRANKHGTREATQMSLFAALTYTLDYFLPLTIVLLHTTLHSSHPLKRSLSVLETILYRELWKLDINHWIEADASLFVMNKSKVVLLSLRIFTLYALRLILFISLHIFLIFNTWWPSIVIKANYKFVTKQESPTKYIYINC